jgi:hypothetical protein
MKHLKTLFGVLALVAAVSCAKQSAKSGQVTFEVSSNQTVADVTKSNVSDYTDLPSAADFTISVSGDEFNWSGKISEWNPAIDLMVGEYSVTASYGDVEDEGFDKPFFTGTTDFTIAGAQTAEVAVNVSLGNTIIMIGCSENFRNYYKDYTFRLTRNGSDIVTFARDENKAAFVDGYKFTIEGTLVSETRTYTFSKDFASLDQATAYTIMFDASNIGGASITITFNDTVETVDLGDIELND